MTDADRVYARFPDFIKEYIYSQGWSELRKIQLASADVIFNTDNNLLLSSSTASGKTEAAFFPIISDIVENPSEKKSVSVLYIAPLKSLINDQFSRLDQLLENAGIPLTHWHGDVGASHKNKLLKNPEGILQITPESLESMLINRSNDVQRIFGSLRFIVIDEIHSLIGQDRGNQVICLLTRLARLIGHTPRRVGLSATLGDLDIASEWLGAGSGRDTSAPIPPKAPLKWRLGLEHFYVQNPNEDQYDSSVSTKERVANLDAGYEFLYDAVYGRKALVFSNSREETEYVTATLRQIAKKRADDDIFLIHHGNLSASLREDAELKMKEDDSKPVVTCATVTMELGIDIGKLQRVCQVGSPTTVSGFLQRLGRSGRRGAPPEMIMVFREENPLPNAPLPEIIPWDLLRGIAIIDLYSTERFIEPPKIRKMPLSLAFHQTLSTVMSSGELIPKALAERVLTLPPLSMLSKEVYRELLVSMINSDYLELTEGGGLIIGLAGERIVNSFKFYAVFKDSEDYTVRCESEEIGTITNPVPKGDRFALAGRVWEVLDVDVPRKLIFVKRVDGKMEISWPGDSGEIHTRLLLAMREVLLGDKEYAYLGDNAKVRLRKARVVAQNAKMKENTVVFLGGQSYVFFPWLGTRSFRTIRRIMQKYSSELGISDIQSQGCCYITFKAKNDAGKLFIDNLSSIIERDGVDTEALVGEGECPVFDKYDEYIPSNLLRSSYASDRLLSEEITDRFERGEIYQ
ncbi:MAG: DEAD/DEAH box helicase [Clostridia bacterium]|nr:DEAD/DEAH box helicase [Clostridia bacterium]